MDVRSTTRRRTAAIAALVVLGTAVLHDLGTARHVLAAPPRPLGCSVTEGVAAGRWTRVAAPRPKEPPAIVERTLYDYGWRVSVDQRDPRVLYVSNVWSVYESADAGCSWQKSFSVFDPPGSPLSNWTDRIVAFHAPGDHDGAPAYMLVDRGGVPFLGVRPPRSDEWVLAPLAAGPANAPVTGRPERMWVAPSDPDVIYVEVAGDPFVKDDDPGRFRLYRSVDGGGHWELQSVFVPGVSEHSWWASDLSCPVGDGNCPVIDVGTMAIDPADPDALWTASPDGIFSSEDGAATWRNVHRATFGTMGPVRAIHLSRDGGGLRVAVVGAWAMAWSEDGGRAWELRPSPLGRGASGQPPPESRAESVASDVAHRLVTVQDHTASYGKTNVLMLRRTGWRSVTPSSLGCTGDVDTRDACLTGLSYVPRARAFYAIEIGGSHLWAFRPRR